MSRLMREGELHMVTMSEALRGYLLNPDQSSEADRKEAADAAYAKGADEIGKFKRAHGMVHSQFHGRIDLIPGRNALMQTEDGLVDEGLNKPAGDEAG